jgi:T4 bacteriophage base plate protein
MRPLSSIELLSVWERGANLGPLARAELFLHTASEPDRDPDPSRLSIGERDSRLLTLREWTFGNEVTAATRCPKCRGEIELSFRISDIRVALCSEPDLTFCWDGYKIQFRLPSCADVAIASQQDSAESPFSRHLVGRCVSSVEREGQTVSTELLPDSVIDALSNRMSEIDPQAETELALSCESCGERWNALFEVESFFWCEVQAWAVRLLEEVHQLAASYGWSEYEILSMSAFRRSVYLDLITG